MKYIATTKDNVKTLNQKQTVIVETINENGKKSRNIYLANFKRRRDAFYDGMVADGMKEVRKGETTKSYRLLKLSKLIAEVSVKGYNTKTNYLISETYNDETPIVTAYVKPAKEEAAEPEAAEAAAEVAEEPADAAEEEATEAEAVEA